MKILAWIVAVSFATGCSHHRALEKPIHPVDPSQFWKDQDARKIFFGEFTGKLKLSYDGKDGDVSGKGRIIGKAPNAYRVELRDAIGRLHYVLIVAGKQVTVHFPRNRQVLREGQGGLLYFKRALGRSIAFTDLANLFGGILPARFDKKKFTSWEWDKSRGGFLGVLDLAGERLQIWVDSGHRAIQAVHWTTKDAQGDEQTLTVEYGGFDPCCEGRPSPPFTLGYDAKLEFEEENTSIEVGWDTLTKPGQTIPNTAFEFAPPAGDKVQEIR